MKTASYLSHLHNLSRAMAEELMIDSHRLVNDAGLSIEPNGYQPLTREQDRCFHLNLLKAVPDPMLGLWVGARASLQALGPLGLVVGSSATSYQSPQMIKLASRIECLQVELDYVVGEQHEAVSVVCQDPDPRLRRFYVVRMLSLLHRLSSDLFTTELAPYRVELPWSRYEFHAMYEQWFDCEVLFDQPRGLIVSPTCTGGKVPLGRDRYVHQSMVQLSHQLAGWLVCNGPCSKEIRRCLDAAIAPYPSMSEVARKLGRSVRSLRRDLAAEHCSFQQLLDLSRQERALALLSQRRITVKEVAFRCGFRDMKSFLGAFKRWTGGLPSHFRPH